MSGAAPDVGSKERYPPRHPSRDTDVGPLARGGTHDSPGGLGNHGADIAGDRGYRPGATRQPTADLGASYQYPPAARGPPPTTAAPPIPPYNAGPSSSAAVPLDTRMGGVTLHDDHDSDDAPTRPRAPEPTSDTSRSEEVDELEQTVALAEYPYSVYNPGTWTAEDDRTLIQARSRGQNWADLQRAHFPAKTANACRKRYERLVERRGIQDYSGQRMERVAGEYMAMRREIWSGLAERLGMKWEVVEALVRRWERLSGVFHYCSGP